MRIHSPIIHEYNALPSSPAQCPLENVLGELRLPNKQIGIEVDVTVKRIGNSDYKPVSLSRDRKIRICLQEHLSHFISRGFNGPYLVDVLDRRSPNKVLEILGDFSKANLIIQIPEIALHYKTPWAAHHNHFRVEDIWRRFWPNISVNSRFPDLAREFLNHGQDLNLFWEPIDDDRYRKDRIDLVRHAKVIIYKLPHLSFSLSGDPNQCLDRDLDFFNSVANEMIVCPLGTTKQIVSQARLWPRPAARGSEIRRPDSARLAIRQAHASV
jgi:hypothetical protein